MDDPLTDPLPGRPPAREPRPEADRAARPAPRRPAATGGGSPWFRPHHAPQQTPHRPVAAEPIPDPGPAPDPVSAPGPAPIPAPVPETAPLPEPAQEPVAAQEPMTAQGSVSVQEPVADDETMALRQAEETGAARPGADAVSRETEATDAPATAAAAAPPATGGRAARRKAAQEAAKRGNRRKGRGSRADAATASSVAAEAPSAPMSRVEARRAERARKESPSVIASRAVGEVFITLGVLMLLFVTYQLWWTNVLAHQQAGGTASNLEHEWDAGGDDRKPDAFSPGQGFAIMYIPKLDVKVPIAEGISKPAVLDRGMVGHYDRNSVKTAMPWDKQGNFAVAGHRNTHGEPFRYINKLSKGDKIVVETGSTYYTYAMESILPQTSPRNISVIGPVPQGSGFKGPGRYLTLTTCTPEFTSTYRMIVWGKMVEERPRSKGKPDALVS
ncbi:class E sortase [Streptomyces sp. NPDC007100]|uniref:class E sortase n=1 Tax=Streptomyces sp. NPDC007100 TaxID=3155602 RepID=UPI0033FE764A